MFVLVHALLVARDTWPKLVFKKPGRAVHSRYCTFPEKGVQSWRIMSYHLQISRSREQTSKP